MNTNHSFNYASREINWSEDTVKLKLEAIGNLSGKKVAWIRSDLSVKKSNCLTRLIWSVVAKHFTWMRKHFYGVDLNQSRSLLVQIGEKIKDNPNIKELYHQAIAKFNQIAPGHKLALDDESIPLPSVGNIENNSLISDPNLQVFGPTDWKEYLGLEIEGEIPPFPKNIVEEVKVLRESVKGKKEAPNCTLIFMPKGLTANKLIYLMKHPKKGQSIYLMSNEFFSYGIFEQILKAYVDKENEESYWFLMTNDVIEGSRHKSYDKQKDLVKDKTNGKCQLPTYLEALAGCALHHVKNGEHMFNHEYWTFTRCQDLVYGHPIIVGGIGGKGGGLFVSSSADPNGTDFVGALALRKFC